MARGRKPKIRISNGHLEEARKKIKSTKKRGRWPKYDEIHPADLDYYIDCFQNPDKVFLHPKYKNACFAKTLHRGEGQVLDPNFGVVLPDEYKIIGTIRFFCNSYDPNSGTPLVDTTCMFRCDRVTCPYNKKGFITETLKNRTFEEDILLAINKRHNTKVDDKNV